MTPLKKQLAALIAAFLTAIAGIGVLVTITDDTGPAGHRTTTTVKIGPRGAPQTPAALAPQAAAVLEQAKRSPELADLVAAPKAAPADVARRQARQTDEQTYDASGVLEGATAQGAKFRCWTAMNGGPRSVRDIALGVVHDTEGTNVKGLADGQGLCGFFQRVQASPTWTVDNEANSWENVPLGRVPWTQAYFNRVACSIEFIGFADPARAQWTYVQLREGARLMAGCFKLAGIPVRRGRVDGATASILRSGVVTHKELGLKGGGHVDPGTAFKMQTFMRLLRAFATGPSSVDRLTCWRLNHWRRAGRPHGRAGRLLAINRRRRDVLAGRQVTCTDRGPVRDV